MTKKIIALLVLWLSFEARVYGSVIGKDEIKTYIEQFPFHEYQLVSVPGNGFYYIDNPNDLIKNFLSKGEMWEAHIAHLIQQHAKAGTVVLDIGAHIGTHTLIASKVVGPEGKVYAFEPQPKLFRELVLNMRANKIENVYFYWSAVGDQKGEVELNPLSSSNEGGTEVCGGSGKFVEIMTIDQLELTNVSLMKIDVEGMENQVLDGAKKTILRNRPVIIIEIMGGHILQTASEEVKEMIFGTINKLNELGYDVHQLWAHDWIAFPKKPPIETGD